MESLKKNQKETDSTVKKMIDAIKKQNPNISQSDLNNRVRIIESEMKRRENESNRIKNEIKNQEKILLEEDFLDKNLEKPVSKNNIEIDDLEGL